MSNTKNQHRGKKYTVPHDVAVAAGLPADGRTFVVYQDEEKHGMVLVQLRDDGGAGRLYPGLVNMEDLEPAPATLKPGTAPRVVTTEAKEKVQMSADPILSLSERIKADAKAAGKTIAEFVTTSLSADQLEPYVTHFGVGGAGNEEEVASAPLAASDETALRTVVALLNQPGMTPQKAVAHLRAQFGSAPSDGPQHTAAQALFLSAVEAIAARDRIDLSAATTKACSEQSALYKAAYPEHHVEAR